MVGAVAMLIGILIGYWIGLNKTNSSAFLEEIKRIKSKSKGWGEPFTVSPDEVSVEKDQKIEEEKQKGERIDVKEFTHGR